jgi:hypothetical protein
MISPVNADEWRQLSAPEKVRLCKLWAEEARKLAIHAHPDRMGSFISVAKAWEELAAELERAHFTKER